MILLHFIMQGEDIIEHTNDNVSCVYVSMCKRKILLSIQNMKILVSALERQVDHEVTLMVKLLIKRVTYQSSPNRISDTIMHVTLNTINNVIHICFTLCLLFHQHPCVGLG
jgi:hypothetical protein